MLDRRVEAGQGRYAGSGGSTCEKCSQPITARQDARRRGESGWVHDVCPD